jgi:hypothetical protein
MSLKCYFVNIYLILLFIYLTEFRDVILTSNWYDPAGLCLFHQYCPIMGPESMYFALIFQFSNLVDNSVAVFNQIFCYECFFWIVFQCTLVTINKLSFPIAQKPGNYIYFPIFCFNNWMTSPNVLD